MNPGTGSTECAGEAFSQNEKNSFSEPQNGSNESIKRWFVAGLAGWSDGSGWPGRAPGGTRSQETEGVWEDVCHALRSTRRPRAEAGRFGSGTMCSLPKGPYSQSGANQPKPFP